MTTPVNRRDLFAALGGMTAMTLASDRAAHAAAELPLSSRELWGWIRAQQVLDPGFTYLDTASLGPGLRGALANEYREQEQFYADPDLYQQQRFSPSGVQSTLQRLATLIGCKSDEVTLTQGATEALAIVAQGLSFGANDEVLIVSHAHPAAIYPWLAQARRHGVAIKQVQLPSPLEGPEQVLGAIAAHVSGRTRLVVCNHVQYTDGAVLPVAEICRFAKERSILTLIDGAQALGSIGVSMESLGCDFYAASCHKWLNGPFGLGLLYVRRELLKVLTPSSVDSNAGWETINRYGQASDDIDPVRAQWPATVRKFGVNLRFLGPKLKALESTLDLRDQLGADRVEARIRELAIYARLRLQALTDIDIVTPHAPGMWAGILALRHRRFQAADLALRLKRSNRILTGAIRVPPNADGAGGFSAVRIALHIYNSHDDVERLARALA